MLKGTAWNTSSADNALWRITDIQSVLIGCGNNSVMVNTSDQNGKGQQAASELSVLEWVLLSWA